MTVIAISYGFDLRRRSLEEGRWSMLSNGMAKKKTMKMRKKYGALHWHVQNRHCFKPLSSILTFVHWH